jgi:hypothetical protein
MRYRVDAMDEGKRVLSLTVEADEAAYAVNLHDPRGDDGSLIDLRSAVEVGAYVARFARRYYGTKAPAPASELLGQWVEVVEADPVVTP